MTLTVDGNTVETEQIMNCQYQSILYNIKFMQIEPILNNVLLGCFLKWSQEVEDKP